MRQLSDFEKQINATLDRLVQNGKATREEATLLLRRLGLLAFNQLRDITPDYKGDYKEPGSMSKTAVAACLFTLPRHQPYLTSLSKPQYVQEAARWWELALKIGWLVESQDGTTVQFSDPAVRDYLCAGAFSQMGLSERLLKLTTHNRPQFGLVWRKWAELNPELLDHLLILFQRQPAIPIMRSRIAVVLGHLADHRAVPALIEALHDPTVKVRYHSILALGKIGDARAIPFLVEQLGEKDTSIWFGLEKVLAQFGSTVFPLVIEALVQREELIGVQDKISWNYDYHYVRQRLFLMNDLKPTDEQLETAFQHPSPAIRALILNLLSRRKPQPHHLMLVWPGLNDQGAQVRHAAILYLRSLSGAVKKPGFSQEELEQFRAVGTTLTNQVTVAGMNALEVVEAILAGQIAEVLLRLLQVERDEAVQVSLIKQLSSLKSERTPGVLLEFYPTATSQVHRAILQTLSSYSQLPAVRHILLEAMLSPETEVREAACWGWRCASSRDTQVVSLLLQALRDSSQLVRWQAAQVLQTWGALRVLEMLGPEQFMTVIGESFLQEANSTNSEILVNLLNKSGLEQAQQLLWDTLQRDMTNQASYRGRLGLLVRWAINSAKNPEQNSQRVKEVLETIFEKFSLDHWQRWDIQNRLVRLGEAGHAILCRNLHNPDPRKRETAINGLSQTQYLPALPGLVWLRNYDRALSKPATQAIKNITEKNSIKEVLAILKELPEYTQLDPKQQGKVRRALWMIKGSDEGRTTVTSHSSCGESNRERRRDRQPSRRPAR